MKAGWQTHPMVIGTAVISLGLLAACSGTTQGAEKPQGTGTGQSSDCNSINRGGNVNLGVREDVVSFDTSQTQDNGSLWADMNIYDQLVELSPDGTKMVPGLAESWDVSADGTSIVFHLRKDAKFYDGTPVTSADVKFSFDRIKSPDAVTNWSLVDLKSTDIVDPNTVKLTLTQVSPAFLSNLTLWATSIVSEAAANKPGSDFKSKPVGSGPFYVKDWKPGQYVELARNPYFWGKDVCGNKYPYVDTVKLMYLPDDNTRVTELRGGQIDATTFVPYNQVASLDAGPDVTAANTPLFGHAALYLNQKFAPFTDVNVTQAIQYALDRGSMVKGVFFGNAHAATSPVDPGLPYSTDAYAYRFDPAKAKELMGKSKSSKGFETNLSYPAGDSTAKAMVSIVQNDLAAIGITVKPQAVDGTTLSAQRRAGEFDIVYALSTSDILDPSQTMIFCCTYYGPAQSGYTGWHDQKADDLFKKTQTTMDPSVRGQLYAEWQKIIMEKAPILFMVNPANTFAYSNSVHGFSLKPFGHYPLQIIWKSK